MIHTAKTMALTKMDIDGRFIVHVGVSEYEDQFVYKPRNDFNDQDKPRWLEAVATDYPGRQYAVFYFLLCTSYRTSLIHLNNDGDSEC